MNKGKKGHSLAGASASRAFVAAIWVGWRQLNR
jgi:hypothetical protein